MATAALAAEDTIEPAGPMCIPKIAHSLGGFRRWVKSPQFPQHARVSFLAGELFVELGPDSAVNVPTSALSLAGFRRWAKSEDFPDRGRISFLAGELFIDMSPEELETHNQVKVVTSSRLFTVADRRDLGRFYGDGTLVTNKRAGLSTEPDGTFVSWESLETQRVRLVPRKGASGQFIEVEGSPDMTLEIISESSVGKDTNRLMLLYYRAGVREYWLIDARGDELIFRIFVHKPAGYIAVPSRQGWLHSPVFGCSFRLRRRRARMNLWRYTLETRSK